MGQRMREGMHIVTTAKAESVGEIELGVDEHENGCRLNVQIKRAWDVVEEVLLLLLENVNCLIIDLCQIKTLILIKSW